MLLILCFFFFIVYLNDWNVVVVVVSVALWVLSINKWYCFCFSLFFSRLAVTDVCHSMLLFVLNSMCKCYFSFPHRYALCWLDFYLWNICLSFFLCSLIRPFNKQSRPKSANETKWKSVNDKVINQLFRKFSSIRYNKHRLIINGQFVDVMH